MRSITFFRSIRQTGIGEYALYLELPAEGRIVKKIMEKSMGVLRIKNASKEFPDELEVPRMYFRQLEVYLKKVIRLVNEDCAKDGVHLKSYIVEKCVFKKKEEGHLIKINIIGIMNKERK